MKKVWQKLCSYFGGFGSVFIVIYTTAVLALQFFQSGLHTAKYVMAIGLIALLLSAALWPVLLRLISKLHLPLRTPQKKEVRDILINSCFYLIPLAVFLVYFIAFFPGGYSYDSCVQYVQARSGNYNDWHPVLHTLLTFKLPLALTGGWIGSVVLLQSLCWCGVIGYACGVIRKRFGIWPAVITMAYILLNPLVMLTSMHPWKDVGFAITALLLGVYALQTVTTKGQWLHKPLNMACVAVVAVVATIIRHNGILFTAPLILGMVLFLSWKRGGALCLSILLLFVAVKGPVYKSLGVEKPDQRQVEMLGLPMTVIGSVVSECPERVDKQTLEFAYRLLPAEDWAAEYQFGNFNSVKNLDTIDLNVIEQYGAGQVLGMMLRCIKASPENALRSVLALTGRLYYIRSAETGFVYPNVMEGTPLKQTPNERLVKLCTDYAELISKYCAPVFMYLGILHLLLLAFILVKSDLKQRLGWGRLLIVLSVFCYNFGTALLLSSHADVFRFLFYTFPLFPVLLMILCGYPQATKEAKK